MKLKKLTPELIVRDVAKSINFYVNVVGLEMVEGNERWARLVVKEGGGEIMLMAKSDFDREIPTLNRQKNDGWFLLIVEIIDIEELFKNIKNKVRLHRELQSTDYGTKEFTIEDPDGYLIQFSQRVGGE